MVTLWLDDSDDLQQAGLQTQSERGVGAGDRVAGLGDVNVKDRLARHLLQVRLGAESCNKPVNEVSENANIFLGDTNQMVATPYWRLVRTARD